MAQLNNITCYKGEAISIAVTMAPDAQNRVPDITGWTLEFTLRPSAGSAVSLVTAAGAIVSGPAGTFTVPLAASDTTRAAQAYAYDIWRTDAGNETVLSIGTFTILQDVR